MLLASLGLGYGVEKSVKVFSVTVSGERFLNLPSHHLVETDWEGDQTAQYKVSQSLAIVVHVKCEVSDDVGDCLAQSLLLPAVCTVVKEGPETANTFLSVSRLRVIEKVRYLNTRLDEELRGEARHVAGEDDGEALQTEHPSLGTLISQQPQDSRLHLKVNN